MRHFARSMMTIMLLTAAITISGCTSHPDGGKDATQNKNATGAAEKGHDDHSAWWCPEHGIPEEICGQCNAKYAAECKKKGDWCDKHDRPDSQCFACHPELEQRFAARYKAKYGADPPKRTEVD